MNEKVQDFRGLGTLLIGNKAERPAKYIHRTAAFSLETSITHGVEAWDGSSPENPETKCEEKGLEVTSAIWKLERESRCFGSVSETRRTQQ